MWPKFGNCGISMREVITTSILTRKTAFFDGWSWFRFNNLGLALGTNWEFYTSVAKGLKLKVRKFLGLIPTFAEMTGEKLVGGGLFGHTPPPRPPSWIGLKLLPMLILELKEFVQDRVGIFNHIFLKSSNTSPNNNVTLYNHVILLNFLFQNLYELFLHARNLHQLYLPYLSDYKIFLFR